MNEAEIISAPFFEAFMEKKIRIWFVLLCIVLLSACDKGDSMDDITMQTQVDNELQITIDNNGGSFYYDKYTFLDTLTLKNTKTDEKYNICNIPGCLHNADSCLGDKFYVAYDFSAIYDEHVLFFNNNENSLYFINVDGTELLKIEKFEDDYQVLEYNKVLVDNHLYVLAAFQKQLVDNDGYLSNDCGYVRVYDIDMINRQCEILYEGEKAVCSYPTSGLLYNDNMLVFSYQNQTKRIEDSGISEKDFYANYDEYFEQRYELQGLQDTIVLLDCQGNYVKKLDWNGTTGSICPSGFVNHTLYGYDHDGIYTYNSDSDLKEQIMSGKEGHSFNVQQSADFVMIWYWKDGMDIAEHYIVRNGETNIRELKKDIIKDFIVDDECYSQLHIQYFLGDGEFDETDSEYVDRDDFISWFE